jgi:hypothetical protein
MGVKKADKKKVSGMESLLLLSETHCFILYLRLPTEIG